VVVVPVTHRAPDDPTTSIELPPAVKTELGLDPGPAWVRLDELNLFAWPGYDLRAIPGTNRIDYGVLPEPLFERVRQGVIDLHRTRRSNQVARD
jgi:hypothetical protein